jgi:predicted CoA-binding protein
MSKKTLVIGASTEPSRYSYKATKMLLSYGHQVILVGKTGGEIDGHTILKEIPETVDQLDTITLYINPQHQLPVMDKLISLHPKRIIFNPGTENVRFTMACNEVGIDAENACTLVLLSTGMY